jgi:hypothetical protein
MAALMKSTGQGVVDIVSEADRKDILWLLGMLLEGWAVSAGLAAEGDWR